MLVPLDFLLHAPHAHALRRPLAMPLFHSEDSCNQTLPDISVWSIVFPTGILYVLWERFSFGTVWTSDNSFRATGKVYLLHAALTGLRYPEAWNVEFSILYHIDCWTSIPFAWVKGENTVDLWPFLCLEFKDILSNRKKHQHQTFVIRHEWGFNIPGGSKNTTERFYQSSKHSVVWYCCYCH